MGWNRDVVREVIVYRALRDIRAGEELCINYGRVWFVDVDVDVDGGEEDVKQQDVDNDEFFLSGIEILE